MDPEPAPQAQIKAEDLPSELIARLSPKTRDALRHPLRRQILRALNSSADPRSSGEIAAIAFPKASVSVVSYHTRVLESCGSIALSGGRQGVGGACLYASKVADDEEVAAVLQATHGSDRWAGDPH